MPDLVAARDAITPGPGADRMTPEPRKAQNPDPPVEPHPPIEP